VRASTEDSKWSPSLRHSRQAIETLDTLYSSAIDIFISSAQHSTAQQDLDADNSRTAECRSQEVPKHDFEHFRSSEQHANRLESHDFLLVFYSGLSLSRTLIENEETRLDAFEAKGLRKILRVSWTAKKTNEWVLNKAGVKRELLDFVKARKLAYNGHTMRKQGSCLEKENNARCTNARKTMHGLDGQHQDVDRTARGRVNQNDKDNWRKYIHGVANPRIGDG